MGGKLKGPACLHLCVHANYACFSLARIGVGHRSIIPWRRIIYCESIFIGAVAKLQKPPWVWSWIPEGWCFPYGFSVGTITVASLAFTFSEQLRLTVCSQGLVRVVGFLQTEAIKQIPESGCGEI